jgi:hypothetical protein
MRILHALTLLTATLFVSTAPAQTARTGFGVDRPDTAVGVNLAPMVHWATEALWVDLFKMSSPWLPQRVSTNDWDTGETLNLTAEGWIASLNPDQAAGTIFMIGTGGRYLGGRFVCLYRGEGQLEFRWDARAVSSQPGRVELDVTPGNGGIYIKQLATNPANPLRDIRFVPAAHELSYLVRPFREEALAPWRSSRVFRFMDWQHTNNSSVANWADRPLPNWKSQDNAKGVALEHLIELANAAEVDPWFCLPHLATNDFVTRFATMVRDRLDARAKVYVEYSNEVWNGQFDAYWHAQAEGLRLGFSSDPYEAALRWYSYRSVQIFEIFRGVFGGTSRLVRVLGSQHVNPWVGTTMMDWQNAYQKCDALAIAAYAGTLLGNPENAGWVTQLTPAEIVVRAAMTIPGSMAWVKQNADEARARGMRLIASEAGAHVVGNGNAVYNNLLTQKLMAANRDPLMEAFYDLFLSAWRQAGGTTLVHFNSTSAYGNFGNFGLLEHFGQPLATAHKYRAFHRFALTNLRWW